MKESDTCTIVFSSKAICADTFKNSAEIKADPVPSTRRVAISLFYKDKKKYAVDE